MFFHFIFNLEFRVTLVQKFSHPKRWLQELNILNKAVWTHDYGRYICLIASNKIFHKLNLCYRHAYSWSQKYFPQQDPLSLYLGPELCYCFCKPCSLDSCTSSISFACFFSMIGGWIGFTRSKIWGKVSFQ